MSKSPCGKNEFIEEKRKLLYWVAQWNDEDFVFDNKCFDIKEMSMLLQMLGFRLEKNLEKVLNTESSSNGIENILKVDLVCPKSSLHSVLIKETASCNCPSEDALNEGEFWSISGSGTSRRGSINSSSSSLLPTITSAKSQIIRGLLSRVFSIMNDVESRDNEDNSETSFATGLVRHRSLDALRTSDIHIQVPVPKDLKRRPSWEVDPKTSPPIQTSSPVPNLCQSLSQISLNSDKSNLVLKNLENIKKLVDETLDFATGNNLTYTRNNIPTKRVSDIKPAESPANNGLSMSKKGSSTPRLVVTPKRKLLSLEKERPTTSRIASLKKRTVGISPTTASSTSKTPIKSTPSPSIVKRNLLKSGESKIAIKSRIAVKSSSAQVGSKTNESTQKVSVKKKLIPSISSTLQNKRL